MQKQHTNECASSKLYLAIDLGGSRWKLAFSDGQRQRARVRTIPARDLLALADEIAIGKQKLGVTESATVLVCFEAGRDGFWLHRFLVSRGMINYVVDPGSIETDRRARRVKTDRIDAEKLVTLLMRHDRGERAGWRIVNVPDERDEDDRRLHRDLQRLNKERTALRTQIHSLLATEGLSLTSFAGLRKRIDKMRRWDDSALMPAMQRSLRQLAERLELVQKQIRELDAEQNAAIEDRAPSDPGTAKKLEQIRMLKMLKGVGIRGSWLLVMEFLGWRKFRNRKELASLAGLCSTPHSSDGTHREQGISKAGNVFIRSRIVELAWMWLRHQPDSALARWFNERWGPGSSRSRRIGIVALARKLLVALWRFVEHGLVPEGAALKPIGGTTR